MAIYQWRDNDRSQPPRIDEIRRAREEVDEPVAYLLVPMSVRDLEELISWARPRKLNVQLWASHVLREVRRRSK